MTSNIGTTGLTGGATHSNDIFTLSGSGTIGGSADGERFVHQILSGDGSLVARVSAPGSSGGNNARIGIQIRDTLDANAKAATLAVTGSQAFRWITRSATGGNSSSSNSNNGTAPNIWVRLVRADDVITASKSTNGTSWTTVGSVNITMGTNCYIGLVTSSGSTTTLNTSRIDNVTCLP